MGELTVNALVALVLGAALAVVLFVPLAAVRYRLAGRLRALDVVVLLAVAVYALSLWTYTLLPLPEPEDLRCVGRQLEPFAFVRDIRDADVAGPRALLRSQVFLQVAFNVVLFVPFGAFFRALTRRGVAGATVAGFVMSLLIETTQGTGVWGLYRCAYRLFDVDDLIVNTSGALLGALVVTPLLGVTARRRDPVQATTVSAGRRLVGMLSDLLVVLLVGTASAIGWRAWQLYAAGTASADVDLGTQTAVQYALPAVIELAFVLIAGRTLGEWVVQLDSVNGPRWLALPQRLLKYAAGVGGLIALLAVRFPYDDAAIAAYLAMTMLGIWLTPDRRGFSNAIAGLRQSIDQRDRSSGKN